MFTEQEDGIGVDFLPKSANICSKCQHYSICPVHWECATLKRWKRWYYEDLDDDDSC